MEANIKVILLLFLFTFSSQASLMENIFIKSYHDDYHVLTCSDNIMRLGNRLRSRGVDLGHARVVFIKHKHAPYRSITPQVTRTPDIKTRWVFHAILIIDNVVFDLDYSTKPKLVSLDFYMKSMWYAEDLNNYVFQSKPFYDYTLSDFGGRFNRDDYPEMNLQDFLATIPTQ